MYKLQLINLKVIEWFFTLVEIGYATRSIAFAVLNFREDNNWQIVSIYQTDVIEIKLVGILAEGDFKQCGGRQCTCSAAFQAAPAVPSLANAHTVLVKMAACSGPHSARPTWRGLEASSLTGLQHESSRGESWCTGTG